MSLNFWFGVSEKEDLKRKSGFEMEKHHYALQRALRETLTHLKATRQEAGTSSQMQEL